LGCLAFPNCLKPVEKECVLGCHLSWVATLGLPPATFLLRAAEVAAQPSSPSRRARGGRLPKLPKACGKGVCLGLPFGRKARGKGVCLLGCHPRARSWGSVRGAVAGSGPDWRQNEGVSTILVKSLLCNCERRHVAAWDFKSREAVQLASSGEQALVLEVCCTFLRQHGAACVLR